MTGSAVISRRDARLFGLKFYYTGKPCVHGHLAMRRVTNGECQKCKNPVGSHRRGCHCPSCIGSGSVLVEGKLLVIISKKDAKAAGLNHYFTGKPCCHGHICERNMDSHCRACRKILMDRYSTKHDPRKREAHRLRNNMPENKEKRRALMASSPYRERDYYRRKRNRVIVAAALKLFPEWKDIEV